MHPHCHPILLSRRSFLKVGSISLATLCMSDWLVQSAGCATRGSSRRLVVLEMNGGNDGLNTVIPYGAGAYYDLRQRLTIPAERVLPLGAMWGLHPSLVNLHRRYQAGQVAIFRGVGHLTNPDLSHFAMMDFWRAGHPEGAARTGQTGWLGRLLDIVGDQSAPIVGLTLSTSESPAMLGRSDKSSAATSAEAGLLDIPESISESFRTAARAMVESQNTDPSPLQAARRGIAGSFTLTDLLSGLNLSHAAPSPTTETGRLLAFAARLLALSPHIHTLHIPLPLDFDTHVNQPARQAANLAEVDSAVEVFLQELEALKLAEHILVMTTSEFGRRAGDNGGDGTDHGTANSLFLIGHGVKGGLYGEAPSLTAPDNNGNLIATLSFLDYLATVAEGWLGAPASEVVPGGQVYQVFK